MRRLPHAVAPMVVVARFRKAVCPTLANSEELIDTTPQPSAPFAFRLACMSARVVLRVIGKNRMSYSKVFMGGSNLACSGEVEFGDAATAGMAASLDDHIDGIFDVLDHVGIGHRDFGFEGRDREALHGQLRGFGMQRGHGPAVA